MTDELEALLADFCRHPNDEAVQAKLADWIVENPGRTIEVIRHLGSTLTESCGQAYTAAEISDVVWSFSPADYNCWEGFDEPDFEDCSTCGGSGEKYGIPCHACGGYGELA